MSKGKFALGALFGAAAGLVTGILTAPKSGKETRSDLKKKAKEIKEDASDKLAVAKDKASDVVSSAKDMTSDYRDRAGRAFDSAKKEFQKQSDK